MSFGEEFKGKIIWGTSVGRILIETDYKKLKDDFTGQVTLYERRHEKSSHKFTNLAEFVSEVRVLWKETTNTDSVQDTRLARWIEEYFHELNIVGNYQDILDAVRGEFHEVPPLELGEKELLTVEQINELIPEQEGFLISGSLQKIKGDFRDTDEVDKILENFLMGNKPKRKTVAITSASFKLSDGQERIIDEQSHLHDHPLSDITILESGLFNDFGVPISNIQINDIIPYDYKVSNIKIEGLIATEIGRTKKDEGLEISWKIDKMDQGNKIKIKYELEKRMIRTILIRDDFDLTLLQTFENINHDENNSWIESTYIFHQQTPIVENVKILDLLPGEYNLTSSKPEAIAPIAKLRSSLKTTEILWSYSEVPAHTQFLVTYDLKTTSKLLRDKIQFVNEKEEAVFNIVRILKPLPDGEGFGAILAIEGLSEWNREIIIREAIPKTYEILKSEVEEGSAIDFEDEDEKIMEWKINGLVKGSLFHAYFQYKGSDTYNFDKLMVKSDSYEITAQKGNEMILKEQKIILPDKYYEAIEN